jgi:D-alanine--poly(phosphoribitol) ligase subunit 1
MTSHDVVDRFLACAARAPDHPAIVNDEVEVTYGALEQRVRAIAAALSAKPAPRVLIALPQAVDAYAAILAVGLVGGYYSPLNVAAPADKLKRIARLFAPDFIIAAPELATVLAGEAPHAQVLDPGRIDPGAQFVGAGTRHHLAYVIFTSGSTGLPKGVMVPRTALSHYVQWMTDTFAIVPGDRFSQHPNLAFDISMTDIFGALCHGATLYPLSRDVDRMMSARMIARHKITVWNSVPSVVSLMMQAGQVTPDLLASVRLFNFCGEPLLPAHLEALFKACPDVLVRNTYGPTEATISVTDLPLRAADWRAAATASIAIGPALAGIGLHLVGGKNADEGEIVITGPQLADGYWQDQVKTDEVFRTVVVDGAPVRGYYTGDWAERSAQGHVFFKERIDFQVKIKGHRVELDEVAAAIRECGWPVVCVFKYGEALAAVVERQPGRDLEERDLLRDVGTKVESHAVPVAVRLIDHMPRNDNDKLDRKAVAAWFDQQKALDR